MNVARKEVKYLVSLIQFQALEPRLAEILPPDAHGDHSGLYHVRSLYFDSLYDDDYLDTLQGTDTRKKIRLRVYPPQENDIKLEYKFKQGEDQQKTSIPLSRGQALEMVGGRYGFLIGISSPKALTIYHEMTANSYRPKLLIAYDRQAYGMPDGGIRVTFDTNIRASRQTDGLFDAGVHFTPLLEADVGVLEIKHGGPMPAGLQDLLLGLDSLPAAMSKYVLGRTELS